MNPHLLLTIIPSGNDIPSHNIIWHAIYGTASKSTFTFVNWCTLYKPLASEECVVSARKQRLTAANLRGNSLTSKVLFIREPGGNKQTAHKIYKIVYDYKKTCNNHNRKITFYFFGEIMILEGIKTVHTKKKLFGNLSEQFPTKRATSRCGVESDWRGISVFIGSLNLNWVIWIFHDLNHPSTQDLSLTSVFRQRLTSQKVAMGSYKCNTGVMRCMWWNDYFGFVRANPPTNYFSFIKLTFKINQIRQIISDTDVKKCRCSFYDEF